MNRLLAPPSACCLLALALLLPAALRAADTDDADEEGWISLFNGKSLEGWKISEDGLFEVQDGTIVAQGPRSHLYTEKEFKDFEFKAEVKSTPGSNSGIYFHTKYLDSGWPEHGHECQVNVTQRDPVKSGSLYGVVKRFETPAKDDVWCEYYIKVEGQRILIKIDGETTVDYTEPDDVQGNRRLSRGSFALQAHDPDSVVYYRNIRVKPLSE